VKSIAVNQVAFRCQNSKAIVATILAWTISTTLGCGGTTDPLPKSDKNPKPNLQASNSNVASPDLASPDAASPDLASPDAGATTIETSVGENADATATSTPTSQPSTESFYTVDHYGLERSPQDDLAISAKRAQEEGKQVLVQVGGDWCGWCHLLTKYFAENEAVNQELSDHYVVMKVNYSQAQKNEAFLSTLPKIQGYPHLFVYDTDGNLLHSQDTGELEEGQGYSQEKVIAFLQAWHSKK